MTVSTSPSSVYRAFGLNFASEIPFLDMKTTTAAPDVTIAFGQIPKGIPNARAKGVRYQAAPGEFLLNVDNIAGYHVTEGRRIVIDPKPNAATEEIILFLMGSAMGALLHQRNMLPLHAGSILVDGAAVLFTGPSGIGKSTIVAAFEKRGLTVLSDDVCAVYAEAGKEANVYAGFPRIKLWADTLEMLETPTKELKQVRLDADFKKFFVPFKNSLHTPVPVRCVFVLNTTNTDTFTVEALHGKDRIDPIYDNTYRINFLGGLGGEKEHFRQCMAVANTASVFKITRPKKVFRIQELMDIIKKHW